MNAELLWHELEAQLTVVTALLVSSGWRLDRTTREPSWEFGDLVSAELSRGRLRGQRRDRISIDVCDNGVVKVWIGDKSEDDVIPDIVASYDPIARLAAMLRTSGLVA